MKKKIASILAALMILSLLTACGTQTADSGERADVIVAVSSEPDTLDPCMGWGHGYTPFIQSTLVEYKQDMSIAYDLATDYTLSEDLLTWTFTIREDAYFTDGEQLTAQDVAFTFTTAKNAQTSLDLTFMDSATATDDFTVEFKLNQPNFTFINTVASVGIVPEHAYTSDYGTNPVGSGPYKFVQWNVGEQLIIVANEDYYGTVPAIEKVVLVFMETDAAFAAVKAGAVDLAVTSPSLANQVVDGYNLTEIATMDNRGFTLPMSFDTGETTEDGYPIGNNVTANLEIRQALAYGIDRDKLTVDALNGYATPAYSENDGMPWNNAEVVIETDLEYAKALLADNGWVDTDGDGIVEKDGVVAQFNCIYPSGDSSRQAVALAAAEQAKEFGIKITVEGTSWDDITKRMFSEAVLMAWGSSNPYTSYSLFHSSYALRDDYYNPEGYTSDATDEYLTKALASATIEESNEFWQLAQYDGETGTSMNTTCPWVWLVNESHLYFVAEGLDIGEQSLHAHGATWPLLQNMREWTWE